MSLNCENTERFVALETAVTGIKLSAEASAKAQNDATEEIKLLGREMRSLLGDLRERSARDSQRVEGLGKGIEVLFQFKRDLEDVKLPAIRESIVQVRAANDVRISEVLEKRVMPIEIKHLKEDGAAAAFKDMRVLVPSALAIGLAVINLWEKLAPWLSKLLK